MNVFLQEFFRKYLEDPLKEILHEFLKQTMEDVLRELEETVQSKTDYLRI